MKHLGRLQVRKWGIVVVFLLTSCNVHVGKQNYEIVPGVRSNPKLEFSSPNTTIRLGYAVQNSNIQIGTTAIEYLGTLDRGLLTTNHIDFLKRKNLGISLFRIYNTDSNFLKGSKVETEILHHENQKILTRLDILTPSKTIDLNTPILFNPRSALDQLVSNLTQQGFLVAYSEGSWDSIDPQSHKILLIPHETFQNKGEITFLFKNVPVIRDHSETTTSTFQFTLQKIPEIP